jgi:hypothetical protein
MAILAKAATGRSAATRVHPDEPHPEPRFQSRLDDSTNLAAVPPGGIRDQDCCSFIAWPGSAGRPWLATPSARPPLSEGILLGSPGGSRPRPVSPARRRWSATVDHRKTGLRAADPWRSLSFGTAAGLDRRGWPDFVGIGSRSGLEQPRSCSAAVRRARHGVAGSPPFHTRACSPCLDFDVEVVIPLQTQ